MKIKNLEISHNKPPVIIAEMSGNHNQSLKKALKIVEKAAKCGAHIIKLQTYTPDTITINSNSKEFFINDPKSIWKGKKLYELYKKAYTPWEWHEAIINKAKKLGIICFSSPFDETAVDFLESLNVPAYKIASFENTHIPLIKKIAQTGKPVILSTGMASLDEIRLAIKTLVKNGCKEYSLLKCTSSYPANPKNINLNTIQDMKKTFKCEVGLSDHTLGISTSIAAIALGATIIEKHFILDRKEGGVDSKFSLEPNEFKNLVDGSLIAWQSLGKIKYGATSEERSSLKNRRSIYFIRDLKKGEIISKDCLKIVRPNKGLSPKYYDKIIGKKTSKKVKKGTALSFNLIK